MPHPAPIFLRRILPAALAAVLFFPSCRPDPTWSGMKQDFADPPARWKPRPLWFWNAPPSRSGTEALMGQSRTAGYGGFGILPTPKMKLAFMGPEYLDRYEEAVEKAASLGMTMCLYDEFWFPSGSAGGLLAAKFPGSLSKRLDRTALPVTGPRRFSAAVPKGELMAAVAMNETTLERLDLASRIKDGRLSWDAPAGRWTVMFFACVPDGARGLVDYLDPAAVRDFISLTYEKYFERLGRHFGTTIDSAFYDEPTFHWVEGGRAWTPKFNERFRAARGGDPTLLYPALWLDIGPDTTAARNALFGFRAELFASGFVKTLADWCRAHGIALTGHVDQEEIVNPVGLCGDLIKCFRDQPIPGVDEIFTYGRASKAYKVVSSAAANYDRRKVMTETYGAMKDMPVATLYREAMDQFAKGINVMVPHAVWTNSADITFPPELSPRTPPYAAELPAYNKYMGRLQRILQQGVPAVDIAVLYPIAGLQAGYHFGTGKPYEGGVIPPEADYMEVGERLSLRLRRDFTYLHPEVLAAQCRVEDGVLRLVHPDWSQAFTTVIVPGGVAIRADNLRAIKAFFDRGGRVIFTTRLPDRSAEPGKDDEVKALLEAMLGGGTKSGGSSPGRAFFVPVPSAAALLAALDEGAAAPDVAWQAPAEAKGGNLSYLHKVIEGRDVYFFANSSDEKAETTVRLRGRFATMEIWDPHTGRVERLKSRRAVDRGRDVTEFSLALPPVHSVFIVARPR
ncbi:MAG: glycosyl hydrolase [Candidatus Aminicenantes bacterium]|nr:glycosyl hydrolase [Candidatus Aminicenantes bacterium]